MIRRPPRSTLSSSSAASDVYKRQAYAPKAVCVPVARTDPPRISVKLPAPPQSKSFLLPQCLHPRAGKAASALRAVAKRSTASASRRAPIAGCTVSAETVRIDQQLMTMEIQKSSTSNE
eukprot:TRINITY_DN21882_c0_g1_i1.p1 TRINITY_DN21882_c0_g1~~TRINITY_DN21882_c0_g1_i1.p1  ORF type:complete len:119 (+),score=8.08 TRINITY_DN21882_c0_g1_i1:77-433(+)